MKEFLIELFPSVYEMFGDLLDSIWQTFVMVGITGILEITIGTLLEVSLVVSAKGSLYGNDLFSNILGGTVSIIRSIPFVILTALMVSFTHFLVGTSVRVRSTIVPTVAGIIPLVARMTEQALLEVDPGVMEAARSMGILRPYIIVHILPQESLPGLLRSLVTNFISLIGLSTVASNVGSGGAGNFVIRYGYSRYMGDITIVTVLLLLLIVNIIQNVGSRTAQWLTHWTLPGVPYFKINRPNSYQKGELP